MASTLHVAMGEAAGDASTATGEEGPILALAEICVCTALSGRLLSQDALTGMCWHPEQDGLQGPRAAQSLQRP
jgi:hypothetical protein